MHDAPFQLRVRRACTRTDDADSVPTRSLFFLKGKSARRHPFLVLPKALFLSCGSSNVLGNGKENGSGKKERPQRGPSFNLYRYR
jgi:hypothetical protein